MDERTRMMMDYESGGYSIAALARRYGVSRKSAYKWIERFASDSFAGLEERSRAPHSQAGAVPQEIVAEVLRLKKRWPLWGAPKLHHKLGQALGAERTPAESTVSNILRRHGLTKAPGRRRQPHPRPPEIYGQQPNEVWCVDFKGWLPLRGGGRCTPLTISDAASRYLIRCHGLGAETTTELVQPVFVAAFREFGLPGAIRSDNGPPFASTGLGGLSRLSVWWLNLGIALQRIEPGHPEQNGRHERLHRTLKEAIGEPARSLCAQQETLRSFREHYNEERPHEALAFAVPGACYRPSPRQWSEKPPGPAEYPDDWETRAVRGGGQMKWKGDDVLVSGALSGERIGLKPAGDGKWAVYFRGQELGQFDERKRRVEPLRRTRRERGLAPSGMGEGSVPAPLRSAGTEPSPMPPPTPQQD